MATTSRTLRAGRGRAPLVGARPLQHRRRRLRQAPARQARDGPRALRRRRPRGRPGASCRTSRRTPPGGWRRMGVERGDRVAVVLPPTPETAAVFFGAWKLGAILLSMSVLYGDEGIAHRLRDSRPRVLVTDADNAGRFDASLVETLALLDAAPLAAADRARRRPTPPPTTPRSSTTPRAPPGWRRASSTPTATSSRTRSSPTATRSRTASASTAWASGRGPPGSPRCWARGASAPSRSSCSARAASTPTSSSTCSAATR